jgi:hypothetical protein
VPTTANISYTSEEINTFALLIAVRFNFKTHTTNDLPRKAIGRGLTLLLLQRPLHIQHQGIRKINSQNPSIAWHQHTVNHKLAP